MKERAAAACPLGACASTSPGIRQVAPQTFEAYTPAFRSDSATALWQGLTAQAQQHCEQHQATAIGLAERRDEPQNQLVLVFRCQ